MELGPPLQASHNSAEQTPKALVQRFIDETLAVALDELRTPDGRPAITIKRRSRQASLFIDFTTGALESDGTETRITYTWPGTNVQEAWKFSISTIPHSEPNN
jgi:meiotic recombination protein SPO11